MRLRTILLALGLLVGLSNIPHAYDDPCSDMVADTTIVGAPRTSSLASQMPAVQEIIEDSLRFIKYGTDYNVGGFDLPVFYRRPATIRAMGGSPQAIAAASDGVVFLRDDFRPELDATILFHEIVHVVQFHNGRDMTDKCLVEKEAYKLQVKFARAYSGYIPGELLMIAVETCGED